MGKLNLQLLSRIGRESVVLTEEKVFGTSGEKEASVRKETVAVSATKHKMVRKNQNKLPPHLPSQPFHEVEVCRGKSIRGKSGHGSIARQPCRYHLKGTCTGNVL